MGQAKHITLYGAAHIDRCGRCFSKPELEKSNPGRFTNRSGGAAWNVASGLSALGANVTLHSIIGNDESGQFLVNAASERSFEFDPQISTYKPTATYTSILAPNGELLIALADMEIYEEFDAEEISNEGWILVDTNLPAAAILKITGTGNNKTAAMTVSPAKAPKLQPALTMIDILFTNRAELAALCSEDIEFSLPELISKFQKLGGKSAVISNGADDIWTVDSNSEIEQHQVPQVSSIVDVTGAGDALAAGTLFELMASKPLAHSVQFGIKLAQAILEVEGAWRPDLKTLL